MPNSTKARKADLSTASETDMAQRPVRVLLVEDDEDDYRLTRDLLREIGERRFALEWVATYDAAVEAMTRREHDVYLVDYRLGRHDGLELLHEPFLVGKPVIMLTGFDDLDVDLKAMEAGAADYLVKGKIDAPLLERSIRYAIERNRAEEALKEADRHKDEFLGMLAHELRNPLSTIRNTVQVLKHLDAPAPNLQWARDVIGRQADHMAHLVEDLLDASRIAHGKVSIRKETIELGQVVGQAVEACRHLLSARKQQVTVSLPSRPVPLLADPTRLVQVLTNLLNNAAKYTDESGQIWLTAAEEEGEVVVRVRDNGIGIAADMLPRVFNLFTQAPAALDRSEGGIGIGLAMVGNLVQLHGGTVQAFSDGRGRGSEFVVRLPLLSATYAKRDGAGETGHLTAESPLRRILVADDNGDLVEAVAQLLRRRGHEVCVVGDGPAALAAARTFRPEVVFLDIELPVLSGYEVARRLRQQPGLENVLLVATTGHAEEEVRYRAHDAGFDAHLAKPYRVDDVLRLLAHGRPGGYAAPRGSTAPCVKAPFVGSS
jgi:signal transduction histidine kinase